MIESPFKTAAERLALKRQLRRDQVATQRRRAAEIAADADPVAWRKAKILVTGHRPSERAIASVLGLSFPQDAGLAVMRLVLKRLRREMQEEEAS